MRDPMLVGATLSRRMGSDSVAEWRLRVSWRGLRVSWRGLLILGEAFGFIGEAFGFLGEAFGFIGAAVLLRRKLRAERRLAIL